MNYLRRLLATALGFILFGIGGVVCKLWLLPYTHGRKRNTPDGVMQARRLIGRIWLWFVRYLVWSGVLRVQFQGLEKLGRPGQLVLANHPSLLDVVLLISHVPELNCVVKKDLQNNPAMNSQIIAAGYILADDMLELMERAADVFHSGQSLLIFPEGTRTGWNGVVKMHRAAVSLGLRYASVITPVCIRMHPPNFKKGQPWYQIPDRTIHYDIVVGEDIHPQDWLKKKPLPIAVRQLNSYLQDYFTRETTGRVA